jgi:signal transduction histidine kinase/ActR/RegA family two-component response regulator
VSVLEQRALGPCLSQNGPEPAPAPSGVEPSTAPRAVRLFPERRREDGLAEMTRLRDHTATEMNERRQVEKEQRFLLDISAEFDSRDCATMLQHLASRAVPFLADFCFVDLISAEETIQRVGWAHFDPAKQELLDQIDQFIPSLHWQGHPVSKALRTGQPDFVPDVSDAWMRAAATSKRHLELMRDLQLRSVIAVPLMAHARRLGTLTFCYSAASGRHYTIRELRIAEDLARRAAAFVEISGLYRRLRETEHRTDEFLAVVGHELRSPLGAIHNALQIIRLKGPADPKHRSATDVVEHQVRHMTRLVDDLLDVSRVKHGKIHLLRERVDLKVVVDRALETSRFLIDARKHDLIVSFPEQAVEVDGDLSRLAQVVSNLLANSAKYTEVAGRIELAVEAHGDEAILRVRDTGAGIAPAMLPRVFDLFTQVPGCENRSEGGLGIGLSLVRNMIDMHGGRVQATSAGLGHGSEFVLRLPLLVRALPSPPSAVKNPAPTSNGPSRRVLVIDDNKDSADTMATLLRLIGHEVRTAYDGSTALDLARQQSPDVVLCDVSMPGMSGLEVARRLREDLGLCDALLVATTGYGHEDDMQRSEEAGFNAHLVKPTDVHALQTLLCREPSLAPRLA